MRRRAFTLVEVLMTAALMTLAVGALVAGLGVMGRQTSHAGRGADRIDAALALLEQVRLELSSAVINPMAHPSQHLDNSILISKPNATSIQFVTEQVVAGALERRLVYYEVTESSPPKDDLDEEPVDDPPPATTAPHALPRGIGPRIDVINGAPRKPHAPRLKPRSSPDARLRLKKTVWKFKHLAPWYDHIKFPPGWKESWIGPVVEKVDDAYADLGLEDIRWQYMVPADPEGRAFLRVKLVLRAPGSSTLLPFTTMVALPSPDLPTRVTACPCLFAPCYATTQDCTCCSRQGWK